MVQVELFSRLPDLHCSRTVAEGRVVDYVEENTKGCGGQRLLPVATLVPGTGLEPV